MVWVDVKHRAYADSELNYTYLSFMTLATLIAGIAIVLGLADFGDWRHGARPGVWSYCCAWRRLGPAALSLAACCCSNPSHWICRSYRPHHCRGPES